MMEAVVAIASASLLVEGGWLRQGGSGVAVEVVGEFEGSFKKARELDVTWTSMADAWSATIPMINPMTIMISVVPCGIPF